MKNQIKIITLTASILLLFSCAPSRFVKPLEKGESALGFNLGGPLIHFAGKTIPVPLSSVTYGKGMNNNSTLFAGIHTTSLLFGTFQGEIGYLKNIYTNKSSKLFIPSISANAVINAAIDKWEWNFKFWPQIDVNAYWSYGKKRNFFYLGCSNWFELSSKRAHQEKQQHHWIFNPQIGHTFSGSKWDYSIEAKYLAPNVSNQNIVADYAKPLGNKGVLGIYVSVAKKIGGISK
ncbi:MAG: hypothetical protein HGB12_04095 [Bacteroidetes bacterium]|nr:hypothetical protein [Bacteroidota bacterium]